jgi:phosphopantothenoylcysteine synthetase/decarboxylase
MALPSYLLELQKVPGWRLRVVLTYTAARIMPPATVALVSDAVFSEDQDRFSPGHVRLARWASHLIVLPATAHLLAQAAHGLPGSLLAATLLAYPRPAMFFPTMNLHMWQQPSVQRNVAMLRADGHHVVEPDLIRCWEMASGSFRLSPGLPGPTEAARMVTAFAAARSDVASGTVPGGDAAEDSAAVSKLSDRAPQTGHS